MTTHLVYVIVVSVLCWSWPSFALQREGTAWLLSHTVPPSTLSNQFVLAEQYASHAQYQDAITVLNQAAHSKDPQTKTYLTRITADGPVALLVDMTRIDYMFKSPYVLNATAAAQARAVLNSYADTNKTMNWNACRELYYLLVNHYTIVQDFPAVLACLRQLFAVDPANGAGYIIALFRHNRPEAEIRAALKTLKDAGGTITPELEIIACKLDRRAGQDTYKKVLAVLLNNPDTPLWPFKDALNEARMQLDVKNPARIKDFYTVLRKLAMIQPPDAQGMEKVQWCMQERTKLEGLVPECLGISAGSGQ